MESKETNIKSQLEGAKKRKTHFVTAMSILGISLVAVVIIAVVMMVANSQKNLSSDGLKLNGNTADELHSAIKSTVTNEDNYAVTMIKTGNVDLYNSYLIGDFREEIVTRVDGDNLYYMSKIEKSYTYFNDKSPSKTTVIKEITVVDGMAYVRIETSEIYADGNASTPNVDMIKYEADKADAYVNSFDVFKRVLWENDQLFDNAKFEETDDGNYSVTSTTNDSEFKDIISKDMKEFFQEHIDWINIVENTKSKDVAYTVSYDEDSRPVSIESGYKIDGITIGEVDMNASVTYGDSEVTLPENADEYSGSK